MFNARKKTHLTIAEDEGYNAAMLGITKNNPYTVGSREYVCWEWGWRDAEDVLEELSNTHSISNEYEYY